MRRPLRVLMPVFGLAIAGMAPAGALAHPHIFVDAVFALADDPGGGVAVRVVWRFDDVYTEFVQSEFDTDGDGVLSDPEVADIAAEFFVDLPEYDYFTRLAVNDDWFTGFTVGDEQVMMADDRLVASFVVRVDRPWSAVESIEIIPFDDEYFIAYAVPGIAPGVFGGDVICDRQSYVLESWYVGEVEVDGLRCDTRSLASAG